MTKKLLNECIEMVKEQCGNEYLYFTHPVEVKLTPHSVPFFAWAVCVSPADELYLMDAGEQWNRLQTSDENAAAVVSSLYQRLKLLRLNNFLKAS